eukprot:2072087-Alexandrium_andersonii.AAC.1
MRRDMSRPALRNFAAAGAASSAGCRIAPDRAIAPTPAIGRPASSEHGPRKRLARPALAAFLM